MIFFISRLNRFNRMTSSTAVTTGPTSTIAPTGVQQKPRQQQAHAQRRPQVIRDRSKSSRRAIIPALLHTSQLSHIIATVATITPSLPLNSLFPSPRR
jgi:hypothetical protein